MQKVPPDIWAAFEWRLDQAQVPAGRRPDYHNWVQFSSILPQVRPFPSLAHEFGPIPH
jgi:hypothetical protein